jgi:CAAX protease family protein
VSTLSRPPAVVDAGTRIDVPAALTTWALAWVVGNVASAIALAASGYAGRDTDAIPIWVLFLGTAVVWAAFLAAMAIVSARRGTGDFRRDYRVRARPTDLLGAPLGVLTQLVLVPVVYLPLEALWPSTFSDDKLSKNANDLADRASGMAVVLLVVMVCVGAPIVEELVYRGLVQGALEARVRGALAVVASAAIFALVHFRPVEYPGLFVVGLVLGACALATGRLGMAMACHIGFNATGLVLAFT